MNTPREQTARAAVPRLGRYEIDAGRSTVTFRTRHLFGLAAVRGTLPVRTGTVDVAEPPAESSVHVGIATGGFHTGDERRDRNVRSANFLDADRHPLITFVSDQVEPGGITGTLTVRGVARTVRLAVESFDADEASGASPGEFTARATTRIDRTGFGVTAARGIAARYLDVTVDVRCVRA